MEIYDTYDHSAIVYLLKKGGMKQSIFSLTYFRQENHKEIRKILINQALRGYAIVVIKWCFFFSKFKPI